MDEPTEPVPLVTFDLKGRREYHVPLEESQQWVADAIANNPEIGKNFAIAIAKHRQAINESLNRPNSGQEGANPEGMK